MALMGALLFTLVLSAVLGGVFVIAGIERRATAAYRLSVELRAATEGAVVLTAGELRTADWSAALAGQGSAAWMMPQPGVDVAALTAGAQAETMMGSAHGADTPVWQVFAQAPWAAVTGHASRAQIVTWVADDWKEGDGDPRLDSNGLLLVRAVALAGIAAAWTEAVCAREPGGQVRLRHVRSW